jgi:FKBP-type peptidyl-prolyl cis-trans isomerase (trigger factor)
MNSHPNNQMGQPVSQATDKSNDKKNSPSLQFSYSCPTENFCSASITIPAALVEQLYHEVSLNQQQISHTKGFSTGSAPIEYIQHHFKKNILEHLKEFLFKYCVINVLYKEIRNNQIVVAGEPRLVNIVLEPGQDGQFFFEFTRCQDLAIHEWKYFPFKAPKRKKYKDLDKQVELFIKTEQTNLEKLSHHTLAAGDWVNFDISIVSEQNKTLADLKQNFWIRLSNERIESPIQELFFGKQRGDFFETNNRGFQDFFSNQLASLYTFRVDIIDVVPYAHFCLDHFKNHFKIKTNKDVHRKMIEVFSYRNDISQRRSMVEKSLELLLSKHQFEVPRHLALRQQKAILEKVKLNPDYNVYRKEKNFQFQIQRLAEKQAREFLFADRFAYHENIDVTHDDVKSYLNLTNRARTKEFIYFQAPSATLYGQEAPIPTEEIKRICLREKAINHAIYHLTKK